MKFRCSFHTHELPSQSCTGRGIWKASNFIRLLRGRERNEVDRGKGRLRIEYKPPLFCFYHNRDYADISRYSQDGQVVVIVEFGGGTVDVGVFTFELEFPGQNAGLVERRFRLKKETIPPTVQYKMPV